MEARRDSNDGCSSPAGTGLRSAAHDHPPQVPSIFSSNQSKPTSKLTSPSRRAATVDVGAATRSSNDRTFSLSRSPESRASGPMSPDTADRVFPIRSFVSVEPTPVAHSSDQGADNYFTARSRQGSRNPANIYSPRLSEASASEYERVSDDKQHQLDNESLDLQATEQAQPRSRQNSTDARGGEHFLESAEQAYNIYSDEASERSQSIKTTGRPSSLISSKSKEDENGGLLTARFKHIVTEEGHAVITGRDGETLQRCEDEPIHIPGAVQTFGALVALQEEEEGRLVVRIVSENSKRVLGYPPKHLFALESFTDILSDEQADNLLDHIDFIKDEGTDVEANGPEVFMMSIRATQRRAQKLWCAIHVNDKLPHLIICEFELEDDPQYPLVPLNNASPELAEDTLNSMPTNDELRESTEARSRPLRILRSARKRKGDAAAMEVFNIMSQVQEQLDKAPNLDVFLKVLVGVVKELTGFHRVMIYQFDQTFNGKVVTELVDYRATKDLYKGLHFPASDIPKQARDLYKINKVRLLYDRDLETSRLVCRTLQDLETPLDLTYSNLRAMSPIHLKYLANMAVRSSMSISINAFDELWGLISCHSYGNKGMRVSFPIRKMCRLIGDSASRNIERLSYASRLQARKLINTAPTAKNPSGYIIASSDDLLKLFDADFGLLSIHDETKVLGKLEATQEALALLEYLRMRRLTSVKTSQDVRMDFPDLRYPPGFQSIAGLLLVPLSVGGNDFIVFFRKGQLREVKWAGNPYEKFIKEGTEGYLEPRKSFKTWSEKVVGKCREWTEEEVETAAVLCLVYGKFIEVWRQKEAAIQNTQLTKLLLANSAHEVRTPLNAIINYLEIALEGAIDQETRDNLAKSHSASKSLIYVINDLLDLTKTESTSGLIREEAFELLATFREAVEMFSGDAKRKKIKFEVIEHPGVPTKVLGDQRRVRQAISNITANAIQATSVGGVRVEIGVAGATEDRIDIEIIVEDTGMGMNPAKLDSLFAELEQAQAEDDYASEDANSQKALTDGKESEKDKGVLGLGLAVVARVVRNMDGQLRLKSEEGRGSRFVINLPFDLPAGEPRQAPPTAEGDTEAAEAPQGHAQERSQEGERTLVGSSGQSRLTSNRPALSRRNSANSLESAGGSSSVKSPSVKSGKSFGSNQSGKSEIDRLIDSMQEPVMINRSQSSDRPHSVRLDSSRSSPASKRRARSFESAGANVPAHLRSSEPSSPGQQVISDTGQPLRPIRMPDEASFPASGHPVVGSAGLEVQQSPSKETRGPGKAENFHVLVAEDDPINSKIVQKRLQKAGHQTYLTVNGEECAGAFEEKCESFDVILMDMQMPILDGMSSTKIIRSFEKTNSTRQLSRRAQLNGRIPIIAVSASLVEKDRQIYIDAGFDGWILKPISFPRLQQLFTGIIDSETRNQCLYEAGCWEQGGWFHRGQLDVPTADTKPSERVPYTETAQPSEEAHGDDKELERQEENDRRPA